jgi:CHAD domain-containing protein
MAGQARSLAEAVIHQHAHRSLDLQEALERCTHDLSEPAVHELRLAARHLEPVLDLLRRLIPADKDQRRTRKAVRRILEVTSDLRDLQIQTIRLAHMPGREALSKALRSMTTFEERKERRRVWKRTDHFTWKTARLAGNHSLPAFPDKAAHEALRSLVDRRVDRLQRRIAELDATEPRSLHCVRVSAKRLRYVLEAFHEHLPPALVRERPKLKRLQERLGHWHDERLFTDRSIQRVEELPPRLRPVCRALAEEMMSWSAVEQQRLTALVRRTRFRDHATLRHGR